MHRQQLQLQQHGFVVQPAWLSSQLLLRSTQHACTQHRRSCSACCGSGAACAVARLDSSCNLRLQLLSRRAAVSASLCVGTCSSRGRGLAVPVSGTAAAQLEQRHRRQQLLRQLAAKGPGKQHPAGHLLASSSRSSSSRGRRQQCRGFCGEHLRLIASVMCCMWVYACACMCEHVR